MLMAPLKIWDTSLSALMLVAIFAAVSNSRIERMRFIPGGAACAIAGLVNPSLLPTLFALCAWAAWRYKKVPVAGVVAFLVVFSPWPLRNAFTLHAFIPFRTNFGYELWVGNHPGGNGDFSDAMDPMTNLDQRNAFLSQGELAYMQGKDSMARGYIHSNPGSFIRLSLKRVFRFWMGTAQGTEGTSAPLVLLAGAGLVLLWRRRALFVLYALPLLLYPLPYYITHADARFQVVMDPLLVILAALAIDALLSFIRPPLASRTDTFGNAGTG